MIKVEVSTDVFEEEAKRLETLGQETYIALETQVRKIFANIYIHMPVLSGSAKSQLRFRQEPGEKLVAIELLNKSGSYYATLGYGSNKYFDTWCDQEDNFKMHHTVDEHTKSEKSRTKRLGHSVKANAQAKHHPFMHALKVHEFTNIRYESDGSVICTPPEGWPYVGRKYE